MDEDVYGGRGGEELGVLDVRLGLRHEGRLVEALEAVEVQVQRGPGVLVLQAEERAAGARAAGAGSVRGRGRRGGASDSPFCPLCFVFLRRRSL